MLQSTRKFVNEWKFISPFAVAFVTYVANVQSEKKETRKRIRLQRINGQLNKLYGPLYGNRLVNDTSFRSVLKKHDGLGNYLQEARDNKDEDMLRQWRVFVINVLYPLDKEAVKLICNNAELIPENDHPPEFDRFLEHVARLQFVMELWKTKSGKIDSKFTDEDFLLENNSSGVKYRRDLVEYVRNKCNDLRHKQTQLELEMDKDEQVGTALKKVFSMFKS